MKRTAMWILLASVAIPAFAQHDAFPFGDPKAGERQFEAKCTECHIRMFGDVPRAFVRENRKARDAPSLLAWVQRCNNANRFGLGREDEESLAAYLNDAFYKFK